MKAWMLLGILLTACVASQDVTVESTTEQDVCNENRDNCPGGHPLTPQQMHDLTDATATSASGGAVPTTKSWGGCTENICLVRLEFSWGALTTACVDYHDGAGPGCSSVWCYGGPSCVPPH